MFTFYSVDPKSQDGEIIEILKCDATCMIDIKMFSFILFSDANKWIKDTQVKNACV